MLRKSVIVRLLEGSDDMLTQINRTVVEPR